jgi:GAF domain-containing protein
LSKPHLLRTIKPIVVGDVEEEQTPAALNVRSINPAIKSTVIVPIVVDGDVRGSFAFNVLSKKHEFLRKDIEHFVSLGKVAALIFKNAYLLEETRIQTERLEALRKAMLAITREHKREPLLRTIIEQAIKLLTAEGGGIYTYRRRRNVLELVEDFKWPNQIGATLKPGEGLSGRLFASSKDYMDTPDYQNSEFKADIIKEDVGSVLAVPLLWQNRRTGVLFVNGERGRDFNEEEAGLLQRFAAMASIALEHGRLRERDHYMVRRLQSLAFATNEIISSIDDPDMNGQLTQIARYAHEILDAEACGIHQVKKPGFLTLVASDGHAPGDFPKGKDFKITSGPGTGLTGHIAHERKPFRKCGKELSNHFAVENRLEAGGCHSLLAIPLMKKTSSGEEVTGLIRISNKRGRRGVSRPWVCFTKADQSVAEVFAQAAAVVLTKTEMLDTIRKGKERYENLLKACNVMLNAVDLWKGLDELAMMLVTLLDKSFCRVFLIDESEKLLRIMAAVQREPKQFDWEPRPDGEVAYISEWRNLDRSLNSGRSSVLKLEGVDGSEGKDDRYNLKRLSKRLKIRDLNNNPLMTRSLLSIPLKVGHRKVGLITVGELEGAVAGGFSEPQIEMARAIASQATLLIDKAWHQAELSRRGELDSALLYALTQIRAAPDVEDLFRVIVRQVTSVFRPATAGIIIQRSGKRLRLIDSFDQSRELKRAKLKELLGTLGTLANEEESRIVYDFKKARREEPFLAKYGLDILLATHITVSSDLRCILFVGDTRTWSHLARADLEILERLGQHCGISITKALAQEQANKTKDGNYLVAEAMALDDSKVMLGKAVAGILKSMICDTVTLYVLDSKKGQLKFPPELAGVKNKAVALKVLENERESVIKRVDAIDRYHAAEDTQNDDLLKGEFVRNEGIRSSAGIPIIAQGKKIGVLFVNYRRPHRFDEDDEKNMEFLAHEAAVAIRNVQLVDEMETKRVHLSALYKTERAIASSLDLESALGIVAEQVWEVACANNRTANVVSINRIENNRARVVAAYPPAELAHIQKELKGEIDLIQGEQIGLVGVAFQSGKSKIFTGLKREPNPHPQHIKLHNLTQSEMVALIRDQDSTIVGAITVENSDEDAFDLDDLSVAETLASQAGVAIHKHQEAKALEKLKRDNARKRVVSLVGVSNSIWRHKINGFAHKISNATAQCLQDNTGRAREAEWKEKLLEIAGYAQDLTRIPVGVPFAKEARVNKPVNRMIRAHITNLEANAENNGVKIRDELSVSDETAVRIDEEWFHEALAFLTQNSLDALRKSPTKELLIRTKIIVDGWCRIEVCDTGPGMDDKTWSKLFEPKEESSEGMGVGLLTALEIIEEYGGFVHRVSNTAHGVTVGFSLPIVS